tara:strand:+ start:359 stop:607 length:249 start_codon:yes stop_codon:yes gene_type:complete
MTLIKPDVYLEWDVSFEVDAEEIVDDARHSIEDIARREAEDAINESGVEYGLERLEERVEALEAKLAKLCAKLAPEVKDAHA